MLFSLSFCPVMVILPVVLNYYKMRGLNKYEQDFDADNCDHLAHILGLFVVQKQSPVSLSHTVNMLTNTDTVDLFSFTTA